MIAGKKIVLIEGINQCGKTTLIKQFKEAYSHEVGTIKFPNNRDIRRQIEFLFKEIHSNDGLSPTQLKNYLMIIHQLFDLDFRQFDFEMYAKVPKVVADRNPEENKKKVYFVDRYYPSNIVYSMLHHLEYPYEWCVNHHITPDMTIFLRVANGIEYVTKFPVYNTKVSIRDETHGIDTQVQLLTPELLFANGQELYDRVLTMFTGLDRLGIYHVVKARQDDTFRQVEQILMSNNIL